MSKLRKMRKLRMMRVSKMQKLRKLRRLRWVSHGPRPALEGGDDEEREHGLRHVVEVELVLLPQPLGRIERKKLRVGG